MTDPPFSQEISIMYPLLIGLMIGLTDLRPGFGGGEGNDRSSELLGTGDLL